MCDVTGGRVRDARSRQIVPSGRVVVRGAGAWLVLERGPSAVDEEGASRGTIGIGDTEAGVTADCGTRIKGLEVFDFETRGYGRSNVACIRVGG